jgi:hypothetical protein
MDTRFWGPSGWKLLHLLCASYEYSAESAISYARFFETIPYILPCKYCRASLTDYYRQHPYSIGGIITNGRNDMNPSLDLPKWMYTIHGCVNAKLKKQGLSVVPSPPFAQVKKTYNDLRKCPWNEQLALVWDFLFAVAYHHPTEKALFAKPMPECPKDVHRCTDPCEKNKWNVLPLKDRVEWFRRFWFFLPAVLPAEMATNWLNQQKKNPPTLSTRQSSLAWLWRMRCGLDAHFKDPYTSICNKIATYSSDCGTKKIGITCRKTLHNRKHKSLRSKHTKKRRHTL